MTFNCLVVLLQEAFVCELEILQSETIENGITVEGEFASEKTMESWGWSKYLESIYGGWINCYFLLRPEGSRGPHNGFSLLPVRQRIASVKHEAQKDAKNLMRPACQQL